MLQIDLGHEGDSSMNKRNNENKLNEVSFFACLCIVIAVYSITVAPVSLEK